MNKRLYVDFHILQTVPPSCINRDDTGSPKTAVYGGVLRARVSSQAWKHAMRAAFAENAQLDVGKRTKKVADLVKEQILPLAPDADADKLAKKALENAGIKFDEKSKKDDTVTKALFFMSTAQAKALAELAVEGSVDKKQYRDALKAAPSMDMALFGRMVADEPSLNYDAAAQVAHSISTHAVQNEYDYFTAVDDCQAEDNAGAGHLGTVEYNSSTLYRYATVNVMELAGQLGAAQAAETAVIFEMTEKGEVKNSRVVHTVIKSDRRFTYEEAQEIIETGKGDFQEEMLQLDKLAKILRENRFKAGAINFDRYEVKFEIDEKGKPVSVYFKESKDANKLIEEFMLLANRTVAEKIGRVPKGKKAKVLPYRIHDLPDPEKLDNLAQFIARFCYKLRTSGTKTDISKSINHLLDDIQGKKEENLIETVSIRAMQKARYSVHNVGHYGLAFDYYTHFTSPIRRYPDMMVHRLLTKYLDQGGRTVSEQKYEALCEHSSSMEQIASNAERASIKYKQVEFMTERLGQTFDGVISGVTEWGLYVELNENKCEGMIPIRDLDDDYYEFDEKNYCLRVRRKNKIYSLGDAITIKVARANLEKKQLDFALV